MKHLAGGESGAWQVLCVSAASFGVGLLNTLIPNISRRALYTSPPFWT